MAQLSELDTAFLYLESDHTPMHNGGLYLFDATTQSPPLSFDQFKQFIESNLSAADFFRKRLVEAPLKLDRPHWVDDPEFNLNRHLHHAEYGHPTSLPELNQLAAKLLATPLKRDRPLWEITFVDNLANIDTLPAASFAIIVKIHLAAINPLSGKDVMSVLLDFSATAKELGKPAPWHPKSSPSTVKRWSNAYAIALNSPFRLATRAKETLSGTVYTRLLRQLTNPNLHPERLDVPRTTINRRINADRSLECIEIPLARLKNIKNKIGHDVTINDVIVGICAQTVNRFLASQDEHPNMPLTAMTPISVRSKNLHRPTGNQMAAMMISLATDEPNPAWRVVHIHQSALTSASYSQAVSATSLTKAVPSSLIGLAARIYAEFQLAQRHRPLFNLPLTNIPGPQKPLYLQGRQLVRQASTAPLFDGIGLGIVAISYHGAVTFSVNSCPSRVCDAGLIVALLDESVTDIENAAEGILEQEPPTYTPKPITKPSPTEIGSAMIKNVFALFNNLFHIEKNQHGKN